MTTNRPSDFDNYWQSTIQELAKYPARPEIEPIPIRDADYATMYGVHLTSVGPYRLFAHLSIPKGDGPFPAIYYTATYGSVLGTVPQGSPNQERSRFITLFIAGRGQRNSDQPYSAMFPGQLTDGIDDAESYVFRGVAADCVRGLEFLLSRPELDESRVIAYGNDMALITAALRSEVTHVVTTPALFHETADLAPKTSAYPLEEVNDFIRLNPDKASAVGNTLAYFNLASHAPNVKANTLILAGPPGSLLDSTSLAPVADQLQGEFTMHDSENSSYKDGLFTIEWMTQQCGYDSPIVPEVWK